MALPTAAETGSRMYASEIRIFTILILRKTGDWALHLKPVLITLFQNSPAIWMLICRPMPMTSTCCCPHLDNHEFVTGIRANRKDSSFKNLQSKIANGYRRMMTGDGVSDTGCPLKVMHTAYAKRIPPMFNGMHRFLPALILLQNGRIKQIPVRHYSRLAGKSKYHLWNRLTGPLSTVSPIAGWRDVI